LRRRQGCFRADVNFGPATAAGPFSCGNGSRLFAGSRLDNVDLGLVAHVLDAPDKATGTTLLDRQLVGAETTRVHINFHRRSLPAIRTLHKSSPLLGPPALGGRPLW